MVYITFILLQQTGFLECLDQCIEVLIFCFLLNLFDCVKYLDISPVVAVVIEPLIVS